MVQRSLDFLIDFLRTNFFMGRGRYLPLPPPFTMEEIQQTLRTHGLKASSQRVAILQYLRSVDTHPTAEQVYENLFPQLEKLSLGTVYNTLKSLKSCGLVQELTIQKQGSRYDGNISFHGHFSCTQCGTLFDLPNQEALQIIPEGFEVHSYQNFLYGLCPRCSKLAQ